MDNLSKRMKSLSPEKQKLIELYLKNAKGTNLFSSIKSVEAQEYYSVSSAQKRLFMVDQLEGANVTYNIPTMMLVEGVVDKNRLGKAFNDLVKRHESLRTCFELIEGEPVQKIMKDIYLEINYTASSEEKIKSDLAHLIKPFDLGKAPLLRVWLIELSERRNILLYDMHHIISDGISSWIMIKELFAFFNGTGLPELKIQYKDFSAWQNGILKSGEIKNQEEYWLNVFQEEIPVLNLPADYPRPPVQSFEGDRISFEVGADLTRGLKEIAAQYSVTMYMVLLAAFNVLLAKYSGQEDIIVGSPIAGRNHADLESIVGMFVNTLAMRNFPQGNKTWMQFLNEVKENSLRAFENQDYQFEELVEKLDIKRNLSRNPLFDTMFSLQNTDHTEFQFSNLKIAPYDFENRISKFDLSLEATVDDDRIEFCFEYCTKLFKKETVQRMAIHYVNILKDMESNPKKKLFQINMISQEEKRRLIYDFNDTVDAYSKDRFIHQMFEEQALKTPDNIALVFGDKQLSYRELNEKSDRLAGILREKGVTPDSIVGIMTEKSLEMMIGIFGILKAGGAYLPIESTYPKDRIQYMIEDSQVRLLLTQGALKKEIHFGGEIIDIEDDSLYAGNPTHLGIVNTSRMLAYVIYTSGTTAKPKGVMIDHSNLSCYVNSFLKEFMLTENDVFVTQASYCFDAFAEEVYPVLLRGGKLVIVEREDVIDIVKFANIIEKQKVNFLSCSPLLISELNKMPRAYFKSIKTYISGGDVLKDEYISNIKKEAVVYNTYGPTEATVCATYFKYVDNGIPNIPIGKPISNYKAFVLDKSLNIQPIGIPGELCISGDGLARGYLNQPELTAEKFVENPFLPGEMIYRTGDLTRWLPDGNIEFLGRIDHQVKIRGYRIELGEIEAVLLKQPNIKEAIVLHKDDEDGNKFLCAYITSEVAVDVSDIRMSLRDKLPEYMAPSYIIQIEKMPLTPNGKINRKALPQPEGRINTGMAYEAPTDEIEEKLVMMWENILNMKHIGINDNFFELGGHSLKAINLVSNIGKAFNVEVPLKEIFSRQTIKELSQFIRNGEKIEFSNIKLVEVQDYYPVSSAQKRLYLLNLMEGPSTTYNMPSVIVMEGSINKVHLEKCFKELVIRHESLRTSFELINGEPVQKILDEVELDIRYFECEEEKTREFINSLIMPFDLNKAPLLRVNLVKLTEDRHILMYDMHHIISDGVSCEIIINELAAIYNGLNLPELKIQYKDFAHWQNNFIKSAAIKKQEEYWLDVFSGEIPVINLPTDFQRPPVQSFEGDRISFEAGMDITAALEAIAAKYGATLYMVLLAAFNVLLSKYTGQDDIVVGSPIAGRNHADLENIVGMFVNTLAMRNFPQGNKTWMQFLNEVKENSLRAFENQDYQFEELVEKLDIKRDLSRNPVFDVMFVLQNMNNSAIDIDKLKISPFDFDYTVSKFDMTLTAFEAEEKISFSLEYSTKLFKKERVIKFADHYVNLLSEIVKQSETKLSGLNLLSEQEKHQVLIDFNCTKADYPKDKTLHALFEEQVERTPGNVALVFKEKSLTYGELNHRANSLACVLRDKGVGRNLVVGIILERSFEMIIGIMAVLKAGGAYLPMSPEYPVERVNYMLKDSGAVLLLTHREYENVYGVMKIETIYLEEESIYCGDSSNRPSENRENDLAYIIYTSGSTGKPKGVMVEHSSVVNLLTSLQKLYPLKETDNFLFKTTYTFDVSVAELFGWFCEGGRLTLLSPGSEKSPLEILDAIDQHDVTHINFVPSMFNVFINQLEREDVKKLNKLKYIFLAGEAVSPGIIHKFNSFNTGIRLENLYGPTESTIYATAYPLEAFDQGLSVPIGKPLDNIKAYIVDQWNRPTPIGVPGELCLSGLGLARGYMNNVNLTKARFVENPFCDNERMYKTGDLARWRSDGNIEFLGRIDHQVKIRGYRIELGEIEAVLLKQNEVKDTVVIDYEDTDGSKYLCGYIVSDIELSVPDLRMRLLNELPDYMVPSCFVHLEKIPLTANGKINRKALPKPDGRIDTGVEYEAPVNEIEEKLVMIWEEILNRKHIGINDNFFDLGGHSLKAAILLSRISKEFNVEISMADIFKAPTVRKMAEYLTSEDVKNWVTGNLDGRWTVEKTDIQQMALKYLEKKKLGVKLQRSITSMLGRAFTLCILLAEEGRESWFYQNYVQICSQTDSMGYTLLDFAEYGTPEGVIEHEQVGYEQLNNENMLEYIIRKINQGYYLLVCMDEYYLEAKASFGKEHFVHESMIYGYDMTCRNFYGVGFNKDGIFDKLSFDFDSVVNAFEEGRLYYRKDAPYADKRAVVVWGTQKQAYNLCFDIDRFLNDLECYLSSSWDVERIYLYATGNRDTANKYGDSIKFGLAVYEVMIQKLKDLSEDRVYIDYRALHLMAEHKKLMSERLKYIKSHFCSEDKFSKLCSRYDSVAKKLEYTRRKFLYLNYHACDSVEAFAAEIEKTIEILKFAREEEQTILIQVHGLLKKYRR